MEELQTPEKNTNTGLSQEACEASGMKEHFCALPDPKTEMKDKIRKDVSMCENANGKASQLEEGDKQYVYAQRFVDPSTCEDLISPSIKKQIKEKKK